jgi:phosphatidylcholine synthase
MNPSLKFIQAACAAQAAWMNFNEGFIVHWGLILSSLYLCFAGIAQQIFPETERNRIA